MTKKESDWVDESNIKSFDSNTPLDVVAATLLERAGVIVRNLAADDLIAKVNQELREPLDSKGHEFVNDFNGYKTRRLGTVLESSPSSAEFGIAVLNVLGKPPMETRVTVNTHEAVDLSNVLVPGR